MILLKIILFPFSILYGVITSIRNLFYNLNIFKTVNFKNVFIINVGNLSAGGTGKTPHVEYLIDLLKDRKKAILSRGYGRKTKGVFIADSNSNPNQIGDEPFQYYSKYNENVKVCVAESRVEGARKLSSTFTEIDTIILDDAFQHRSIDRDLNVMLTDYNNLFYNDYMLPSGRLREFRTGAQRADAIVVSKCLVSLNENSKEKIKLSIREYSNAQVFFSSIKYQEIDSEIKQCILVTGLANSKAILEHLISLNIEVKKHFDFPDHYNYQKSDLEKIRRECPNQTIITTEKDYTKLQQFDLKNFTIIPLAIKVRFDGSGFDNFILSNLR